MKGWRCGDCCRRLRMASAAAREEEEERRRRLAGRERERRSEISARGNSRSRLHGMGNFLIPRPGDLELVIKYKEPCFASPRLARSQLSHPQLRRGASSCPRNTESERERGASSHLIRGFIRFAPTRELVTALALPRTARTRRPDRTIFAAAPPDRCDICPLDEKRPGSGARAEGGV